MRKLQLTAVFAVLLFSTGAWAQSQDFMSGRLFQIALENAPDFTAAATPTFGTLTTGATQSIEQNLMAGHCYVWVAVGDTGQTDVDLVVYVGGVQVAGDNATDDWPIARYCSATNTPARVDLLMYSGSGGFGFNTYSKFVGGSDQIEIQMNYYSSIFAPDQPPQGVINRSTLATGGEQTLTIPLSAGQCYTILGTSGQGVEDIDFFLLDPAGQLVDSDEAVDNYPVVGVCPPTSGNYTLRVGMYRGSGEFGWRVFATSVQ